jgi:hypothetical protein
MLCFFVGGIIMLQSTSESEERNFDDIQRALDIEHTVKALEAQLCYDQHSPEEVARQILKAACKFYDADWCGLIQVDLDLKIWTPFWWYNDSSEDKTAILTEEFESAEFLDRWVQAVRHGKPMIVPDAEEVKTPILRSIISISVWESNLSLVLLWSRALSLYLRYAIPSGTFPKRVFCGCWRMFFSLLTKTKR